tara:strand:- start:3340 stop:3480 length:141 start_codon:yes stop_codon:yes gene_type:complete
MVSEKKCTCGKTKNHDGYCDGSHNDDCEEGLDQNEDVPFADKYSEA